MYLKILLLFLIIQNSYCSQNERIDFENIYYIDKNDYLKNIFIEKQTFYAQPRFLLSGISKTSGKVLLKRLWCNILNLLYITQTPSIGPQKSDILWYLASKS
ncbi:MAG TPA: hypothetical protein VL201_03770, partial [Patescibacteria group bacterium]|nr:hypothetical protein [Patescibacteria group bacterium]